MAPEEESALLGALKAADLGMIKPILVGNRDRILEIAALHGIGHRGNDLDRDAEVGKTVAAFIAGLHGSDDELRQYAEAARLGRVQ